MNFVIIDDHPFILEGYANVIKQNYPQSTIVKLASCEAVFDYFSNNAEAKRTDMVLVDFNIPSFEEEQLKNGIDAANFIRQIIPYCKVILLTAHTEKIYILDIIKNAKPDGFVTKGELTPEYLLELIQIVLDQGKFYSDFIQKTFNESLNDKSLIDDYNRQIVR